MKRHLGILVRILLALAGVAFIGWSLTWHDHVVLPPHTTIGSVHVGEKALSYRILTRHDHLLTLETPTGQIFTLPTASLGHRADQPRLRPGIFTTLGGADLGLLVLGLLLTGLIFPLQTLRWLILLRSRNLDVTYVKALRLTMVGQFFNFCMPGTTGGDVMKAYYAAKNSGQRGAAIMSVLFDRIGGLMGMLLLGAVVGLTLLDRPMIRNLTILVWAGIAVLVLMGAVYFSRRLRRLLLIDRLLARLPAAGLVQKIDQTASAFRDHPLAVLMTILISLPAQVCLMLATGLAGHALGITESLWVLVTVLPVVFVAGALPLTYQGLGIMEGLAIALLVTPGLATANQIVGMLLLFRLFMIFYAFVGSVVLLRSDVHLFPPTEPTTTSTSAPSSEPAPA